MRNFDLIRQFHAKFDPEKGQDAALLQRRVGYMQEEMREVAEAADDMAAEPTDANKAHLLKELTDLLYITYGTIEKLGWDADAAFAEVHASNMSKELSPEVHGKLVKGAGFKLAEMERFVA